MAYGLGASVVIIGALFKILHWEIAGVVNGSQLAIGLITEAFIFAISAFETQRKNTTGPCLSRIKSNWSDAKSHCTRCFGSKN